VRNRVDNELAALMGESYIRAYPSLIKAQQLAELEEVLISEAIG
jgi:hypothetical protein